MFVAAGAKSRIAVARRERFATQYVTPLVEEAAKLGISTTDLVALIRKEESK